MMYYIGLYQNFINTQQHIIKMINKMINEGINIINIIL